MFHAALFDMDDTLIDQCAAYEGVFRVFYNQQEAIHSITNWEEALEFF